MKMLKPLVVATVMAVLVSAMAETITTNMVTVTPNIREVNGQIYNTEKSVLWRQITGKCVDLQSGGPILRTFATNIQFRTITPIITNLNDDGTIASLGTGKPYQQIVASNVVPDKFYLVRNFAIAHVGEMYSIPVMQVGMTNYLETNIEVWDCGVPRIMPIVLTNTATNFSPTR